MRLNLPWLDEDELSAVAKVLNSGYLTQGPRTHEFEEAIKQIVGTAHAAAVSSATTGLHLALVALGVGRGDEVIVPAFSFPATANVIVQLEAIPVFVDINPMTFNLDPAGLEAAMTVRTAAIMPVHAFGLCADMDPINSIASRNEVPVIEDAACALAGTYKGRQAGSLGKIGVFSFHPRKVITTGEGGMIMTDDARLADRISILRAHGAVRGPLFQEFVDAGYNYRLSDVHAAIGIAQLAKLERILAGRRERAAELDRRLSDLGDYLRTPVVPGNVEHTYQSYVVLLNDEVNRDGVIRSLRALGIESTLGTYGMHIQPYFRDRFKLSPDDLPVATRAHHQALTLPLYPQLTDDDLDELAVSLRLSIEENRRH